MDLINGIPRDTWINRHNHKVALHNAITQPLHRGGWLRVAAVYRERLKKFCDASLVYG